MSEEAKDKAPENIPPAETAASNPEAPAVDGAKKILQELDRAASGAAPVPAPPAASAPEASPPESIPAAQEIPPADLASADVAAPPAEPPISAAEPASSEQKESPLITDAMRRLDELLSRFRQN